MKSLESKRQEKERGVSVEAVMSDVLNHECLKDIVVVGIDQDDEVVLAYSMDSRLEMIGLLETLKTSLVDELNHP